MKEEDWLEDQEGHGQRVLKQIWQNLRSTEGMSTAEKNGERML